MVSVDIKGGMEDMAFFGLPQARDEVIALNEAIDNDFVDVATDTAAAQADAPAGPEPTLGVEGKPEERPPIVTSLLGQMTVRRTYQHGLVASGMSSTSDTVFYRT